VKGWTPPEFQVLRNLDLTQNWLPLAQLTVAESSSYPQSVSLSLSHEIASSEAVSKSKSCSVSFSGLRNSAIVARINLQCQEIKQLFHILQTTATVTAL
jgi:hypothetical protein